jgi:hypothetical protein
MSWQPIEAAPKDGTHVIVSTGVSVGEAWYSEKHGGWWWSNCHPTDAYDGEVMYATHWMPLPDPPRLPVDEEGV